MLLLGTVSAAALAAVAARNSANVAETSEESRDLKTRRYKTDLQNFIAETQKIIPALSTYGRSWRVTQSETENDSANIKAEVPVIFFTDDLEIKASFDAVKKETVVDIRSASRVGKSDFGENRRHISQILNALDEKFDRHF